MINTRAVLRQNCAMIGLLLAIIAFSGFLAAWDFLFSQRMQSGGNAVTGQVAPVAGALNARGLMAECSRH